MRRGEQGEGQAFFIVIAAILLAIGVIIWAPAVKDCNERGGVLTVDAFNMPACVAAAP